MNLTNIYEFHSQLISIIAHAIKLGKILVNSPKTSLNTYTILRNILEDGLRPIHLYLNFSWNSVLKIYKHFVFNQDFVISDLYFYLLPSNFDLFIF